MWSSILIYIFAIEFGSTAILEKRAACNADNCLRAVRASTAPGRGAADCTKYLISTSTLDGA